MNGPVLVEAWDEDPLPVPSTPVARGPYRRRLAAPRTRAAEQPVEQTVGPTELEALRLLRDRVVRP